MQSYYRRSSSKFPTRYRQNWGKHLDSLVMYAVVLLVRSAHECLSLCCSVIVMFVKLFVYFLRNKNYILLHISKCLTIYRFSSIQYCFKRQRSFIQTYELKGEWLMVQDCKEAEIIKHIYLLHNTWVGLESITWFCTSTTMLIRVQNVLLSFQKFI